MIERFNSPQQAIRFLKARGVIRREQIVSKLSRPLLILQDNQPECRDELNAAEYLANSDLYEMITEGSLIP